MVESFPDEQKILWEEEKLLVTNNFSFSHSVFKRLLLQTCKHQGLFGKGLTCIFPFSDHIFKTNENKFIFSSADAFNLDQSILSFGIEKIRTVIMKNKFPLNEMHVNLLRN